MFGFCGLRDWLLGTALGCATILLILGRIFSGLDLLGTSGKTVGRTDRNSAEAPAHRFAYTPPSFPESNASPLPEPTGWVIQG